MLQLKNISFSAAEGKAGILSGVDLTFETGKYYVITGPNGGGKTTLAKVIMGINTPTDGRVLLDGTDVTDMSVTERAKLGISYAFQQPPRFKGITVQDLLNIASGKKLDRAECCKYLTKVGLCATDYIGREVDASLSGGEMKRIEIATVFAKQSKVMIFDEPEAGIDLWSFSKLTEAFREIHETTDATLIIISHQERIISQADEVVLLASGKVTKQGKPGEVLGTILGYGGGCKYMED